VRRKGHVSMIGRIRKTKPLNARLPPESPTDCAKYDCSPFRRETAKLELYVKRNAACRHY
jgi:hypothetical protein